MINDFHVWIQIWKDVSTCISCSYESSHSGAFPLHRSYQPNFRQGKNGFFQLFLQTVHVVCASVVNHQNFLQGDVWRSQQHAVYGSHHRCEMLVVKRYHNRYARQNTIVQVLVLRMTVTVPCVPDVSVQRNSLASQMVVREETVALILLRNVAQSIFVLPEPSLIHRQVFISAFEQ